MFTELRLLCAAACAVVATGCANTLTPAPAANEVAGRGEGAVATDQGVRLVARADAWQGTPRNLQQQLTPMLVTIVNESAAPVRISYNKFRLVSDAGRRYSALPPFQIDGKVANRIGTAYYAPVGFNYAPYLSAYMATGGTWKSPYVTNQLYFDRYAPVMRTVNLPSTDMLQKALPEGVLQPGGRVTGFLYFEGVGPGTGQVRLIADFPNQQTGQRVTRLAIPFKVG